MQKVSFLVVAGAFAVVSSLPSFTGGVLAQGTSRAGSGNPISQAGTGHEDGSQQPSCIDQQMPLAPVDLLAALIPTLGTAPLGGLDRLTLDARST